MRSLANGGLVVGWLALGACRDDGAADDAATADADTDTDTDADSDADTDSDTDSDTDADTDSDADTDADLLFDAEHVLVIPTADGLTLLASDGTAVFDRSWTELVGDCSACGGEGATADADGLLVAFTTGGGLPGGNIGGIARLDAAAALDFRVDGLTFPHDAVRDPADQTLIVSEATGGQLRWIAGDGSSADEIRALDNGDPDWPSDTPNGMELVPYGGRTYLAASHRGGGSGGPGGLQDPSGEITMWDLTDPAAPSLVWTYPPSGSLFTPHGAVFRRYDGRWWLLYAHSDGNGSTSSVGLAVTDDPTVAPAYVADLLPANVDPFEFLRGVELTSDGWLWLTDSGTQGGPGGPGPASGRVVVAAMPTLAPTGATGAYGDQVFVDLTEDAVVVDDLANPFEGWLWRPTFPL